MEHPQTSPTDTLRRDTVFMLPSDSPPGAPAWWQGAVVGFADIGRRWLKARYPSLRHQHDDLLGESVLQLTRALKDPREQWPVSWFGSKDPGSDDVKRFHGLAFTVLTRRVQDEFRREVDSWLESLDDVPEDQHPASEAPDAATALGHTRAIRALVQAMHAMSLRDQDLIERVVMGDSSQPMSGAERERISQLRRRLRQQLGKVLGEEGLAVVKLSDKNRGEGGGS
jgi:hypothetical protein